jgi:serine/threonine protein phosphatase PrpC
MPLSRRGPARLLATRCPGSAGISFSGAFSSGRRSAVFRGFVHGIGIDGLGSIVHGCMSGTQPGARRGVYGYIAVNDRYVLLGGFERRAVRRVETLIDARRVSGRLLMSLYSEAGGAVSEDSAAKISVRDCATGRLLHMGVVADGVGGLGRGDAASAAAVMLFVRGVLERAVSPIGGNALREIVEGIHHHLYSQLTSMGISAGSTLSGVVIEHVDGEDVARFHAVNVGDSPIYHIAQGSVAELSISDRVSEHTISQALGHTLRQVHVRGGEMRTGDYIVLVTDGVSDAVGPEEVRAIVLRDVYPWSISRSLVRRARALGSRDDATALVAWFKD